MKRSAAAVIATFALAVFFFFSSPAFANDREIRILHVNDFHGFAQSHKRLGSDELQGGIAYLAALAGQLKQEKPSVLLSAGDMIQGNTWANLFEGKPVIEVMNAMGFDAAVVGNHEFDFGKTALIERVKEAKFPVLGANVEGLDVLKPYIIKEVDGIKMGIIGVVTEYTPSATHPKNVEGLKFLPVATTVERCIEELKGRADIVVVLSHIGYDADMTLADTVKGIDVIVGGHSHTKTGRHIVVGNTIVVQAWEHGLVLGVLDLTVKDGKIINAASRLEEVSPSKIKKPREDVARVVDEYARQVNGIMGRVIGKTSVDLDGENVRVRQTNLGSFIADIFRKESGADAVIINGGGIRDSIRKGDITVENVYSVLPFNNYIVAIRLTGKQVRDALEYGLSGIETREGRFPQVAGLAFTYFAKHPAGSRVGNILIDGKPIDPAKQYVVATNDFLAAGGDGYQVFREAIRQSPDFAIIGGTIKSDNLVYNDAGTWLRDIVVRSVEEKKNITPPLEGRINRAD